MRITKMSSPSGIPDLSTRSPRPRLVFAKNKSGIARQQGSRCQRGIPSPMCTCQVLLEPWMVLAEIDISYRLDRLRGCTTSIEVTEFTRMQDDNRINHHLRVVSHVRVMHLVSTGCRYQIRSRSHHKHAKTEQAVRTPGVRRRQRPTPTHTSHARELTRRCRISSDCLDKTTFHEMLSWRRLK